MNSPGHRANLLDPNSREVGIGYYRRESDGRGYAMQDFGADPAFPPVIIENEAITVTSPAVNLYIYDRAAGDGFAEMGPATEMRISNEPCFRNAVWEPSTNERAWQLENGCSCKK
ncbi:MAG TPA: CAP domain-containing protein [Anaerolineae bacterium]|nr:CAP domain-containing protein [Anaerolineae bacterium]